MAWDGRVPFDKKGNLMPLAFAPGQIAQQAGTYLPDYEYRAAEWRENRVFRATLVYTGYYKGRTSTRLQFRVGGENRTVEMFIKDFDTAIKQYGFDGQRITGQWTYVKRGQNFGIAPT